jgi:hypothetical protein
MNPLAVGLMAFGLLSLLFGTFLLIKSRKAMGAIFSVLGFAAIATPFVVSYFLAR